MPSAFRSWTRETTSGVLISNLIGIAALVTAMSLFFKLLNKNDGGLISGIATAPIPVYIAAGGVMYIVSIWIDLRSSKR
jgi:hypothetical protein